MRKLEKNKSFIPEEFYKKNKKLNLQEFRHFITILFILNLLLIPNTIGYFQEKQNKHTQNVNIIESSYSVDEIKLWINNIFIDGILKAQISPNEGEIIVNNLDDFYNHNLQKKINITYVSSKDENCKVGVKLNE